MSMSASLYLLLVAMTIGSVVDAVSISDYTVIIEGGTCAAPGYKEESDMLIDEFETTGCRELIDSLVLDTCCDLYMLDHLISNEYNVRGDKMFCDATPSDGVWTVIMRRNHRDTLPSTYGPEKAYYDFKFSKDWKRFTRLSGFGKPTRNHWVSLEHIHDLTTDYPTQLRIELWNNTGSHQREIVTYDSFQVLGSETRYQMRISGFATKGSLGDMFGPHNRTAFSTYDNIWEHADASCVKQFHGGWWYSNCFKFLPTASGYPVFWGEKAFDSVEMKIRPKIPLCGFNI